MSYAYTFEWVYIIKQTRTLEKADPMLKFIVLVENYFLKFEGAF